jgi:hypothetical protein
MEIQVDTCCGVTPAYLQTVFFENNSTSDVTITLATGAELVIAAGTNAIAQVKDLVPVAVEAAGDADFEVFSTADASLDTGTISDTGSIDLTALTTALRVEFTDAV